jgi:hypothetical protein
MYDIIQDISTGRLEISDRFDILAATGSANQTPILLSPGDEYILQFPNLQNVTKITNFAYDTLGINDTRFLLPYYRLSNNINGTSWTEWLDLKKFVDNSPPLDPAEPLSIEIKWVRKGRSTIGVIKILEYKLIGILDRPVITDGSSVVVKKGDMKIIKTTDILKVFSISDVEIISPSNPTGLPSGCDVFFRYSQDSSRSWSRWEYFTKENIQSNRINPIRFFQIEYKIENNSTQDVTILDINLLGDFQNVTNDYSKSNLFGIRECCESNLNGTYDSNGNFIPNTVLNSTGGGPACDVNTFKPMTDDEKANLYNPYAQNTAVKLLEKLSNDSQQVFGHKVIYFATDPDKKGQDHTLNEYQLYNVVCQGDVKVSIEGNNFPDSQIVMNQFDLNLFETMEAHITKQQFKEVFGVHRRPAKEDFLYFCNLNRMYSVDHAQQFRNFNNAAVYYKLILKKYNKTANVQVANIEIKNTLDKLTKNTTIDELIGLEKEQDKASVANKSQFRPLTKDPIRLEYKATIEKELIENSSTIISKANYDMGSVQYRTTAVKYHNLDSELKISENISLTLWFNINNYISDEIYNFYYNYDDVNKSGYKIDLTNDKILVTTNELTYTFNLNQTFDCTALNEETWYCYVLNIDQRIKNISQYIYKRNVEFEEDAANLVSTILRDVNQNSQSFTPFEYQIERYPEILGSDMKLTNVRLFTEIIPKEVHNKILNQYIIRDDSKYLIFADNATTRLYLPNFPLFE